jgi:hypothetical protein
MLRAKIIQGPTPMELGMWGMVSSYIFIVKVRGNVFQLNVHCQKLTPQPGTEFRQTSFSGYDLFTGRKVSGEYYWTDSLPEHGTLKISKSQAKDTETARIYGPSGSRLRKKPLEPFLEKLRSIN